MFSLREFCVEGKRVGCFTFQFPDEWRHKEVGDSFGKKEDDVNNVRI